MGTIYSKIRLVFFAVLCYNKERLVVDSFQTRACLPPIRIRKSLSNETAFFNKCITPG